MQSPITMTHTNQNGDLIMAIVKKFIGQLVGGETVILKEFRAGVRTDIECKLESIDFVSQSECDSAALEIMFPCGAVKKQSWYVIEEISVVI